MKTILLPTDFSNNSINAIGYAVQLFKEEKCHFILLNIQKASSFISDDFMTMTSSTTIYQTLIDTAKHSITNLINNLKKEHNNPKHEFIPLVDYDNFIDGINQACLKHNVDLIVMGTQGATGAERVIFGSNTVRVIQRCPTPVLVIPEGCSYQKIDKIAFTSNYLSKYETEELSPLLDIALSHDSILEILHMVEEDHLSADQENNKNFIDFIFKNVKHEFIDLENTNLYEQVHNFIKTNDVKLLAMMSQKHSFFERLFTLHNVETFGFQIDVPFLVMEHTGKVYENRSN